MPNAHDARAKAQSIVDTADDEDRDLTVSEGRRVDRLLDEAESSTSRGRRSSREQPINDDGIRTRYVGRSDRGDWGMSAGAYLQTVKSACYVGGGQSVQRARDRLQNAATTYGSEATGPDGAFAIPPDFRENILQKVMGSESLLSRCDQIPTTSNGLVFPKDELAPWAATGVQAYWTGEAQQMTQSKPILEKTTVTIEKLTALCPVTDELLEDAAALGPFVQKKGAQVIDFKCSDAIVNGTGAGIPLGILNSPCTVSVAKETSQAVDSILGLNVTKMWARMPAPWRKSAVWLIHPDNEPNLMSAGIQITDAAGTTAVGGQLVWQPANGLSGSPFATLMGRPVIPFEGCAIPGDVGDIIFASLSQYCAGIKGAGLKIESSIHLFFDYGLTAFRFTFRMGGQPWWSGPLAALHGSTTYSAFVTLAAR
jgi:HK97 family phage major capsid protein